MWARANRKTDRQTLKVIYLKVGALIWVFAGTEADPYLQLWTKLYNGGLGAEPQRGQRQSPAARWRRWSGRGGCGARRRAAARPKPSAAPCTVRAHAAG